MDLEQQLRAALAPCKPGPELRAAVMVRVSATARSSRGARRKPSGPILLGTVLVVAAAAALLVMHLMGTTAPQPVAVAPPAAPVVPARIPETVVKVVEVAPPAKRTLPALHPPQDQPVSKETISAVKPFTVLVLPLRLETSDPGFGSAAREFYNSALDELRAIPGLLLVGTDQSGGAPAESADFRLAFTGGADDANQVSAAIPDATGQWRMALKVESPGLKSHSVVENNDGHFDGYVQLVAGGPMVPMISPPAGQGMSAAHGGTAADAPQSSSGSANDYQQVFITASSAMTADCDKPVQPDLPTGMCGIPANAAALVEQLRMNVFPLDSELERKLQARLLDPRQSYAARLAAFDYLRQLQQRKHAASLNADIIHRALDLLADAPDASTRTHIRSLLRGQTDPALLQSLLDLAREDSDVRVRLEAVTALIRDFDADPAARAALESIASSDPKPLVRMIAAHGRSGDAAWHDYVVATVTDVQLPAAERFEPIAYMVETNQSRDALTHLDAGILDALVDVLPQMLMDPTNRSDAISLLINLGNANRQAAVDLVLASFDAFNGVETNATMIGTRRIVFETLTRHLDDPRARKKVEEIAAGDPDALLQKIAARALQSGVAPQSPTR